MSIKILYVTDLHGVKWKYERIIQEANSLEVDIIINGGDMLPMLVDDYLKQDKFITDFLDDYFSKLNSNKMYYLCLLGNDDLIISDENFHKICDKYSYVVNMAQTKFEIEGHKYEFIGMNWVNDLPFSLKDRVRKDSKNYIFPKQLCDPLISTPKGWKQIKDWELYIANLPTIEDEMNKLVGPNNISNTIYIIHMPPSNLGLDVCGDGKKVGSRAIYEFLKKHQPLLSFHGHIHESPEISGKWYSPLLTTLVIQPGQSLYYENFVIFVTIELEPMKLERFKLKNQ